MEQGEDPRIVYADIIDLPRHLSSTRMPMPMEERAAQFAAYDALTGFFDMIAEEERLTDSDAVPDEDALAELDRELGEIARQIGEGGRPMARFIVFVPDERKAGGRFEEIRDRVYQIDGTRGCVVLESRQGRGGRRRELAIGSIRRVQIENAGKD